MKKFLLLTLFLFLAAGLYLMHEFKRPGPLTEQATVFIPRGTTERAAADILSRAKVIRSSTLFRLAARFSSADTRLRAGEYEFEPQASLEKVIAKLAAGDIYYRQITLPEGLSSRQIVELISAEPALTGEIHTVPAEGSLLPETYSFVKGDSRQSIIKQAEKAMRKLREALWKERDADLPLVTEEEMTVLASIIEKETGRVEERGIVSSVFINRLKKGMRLQTDPTVIYALTQGAGELTRPLLKKDLDIDSPFNTYKFFGLPPAPICNPGREALKAAVHPAETDFLYFVADGKGGHSFSRTLREHNRNVQKWKKSLTN